MFVNYLKKEMEKENNKSYVQRKKMLLNGHLIGKLHDEEIVKVYKNFILFLRAADQDRAKKKIAVRWAGLAVLSCKVHSKEERSGGTVD